MFTVTEFRLIRDKCPADFAGLLNKLGIAAPNWSVGDELQIANRLDDEITDKLSHLMKSDSVISGYIDLLTLGKVNFKLSETDNALLARVVDNKDAVMRGATAMQTTNVAPRTTPTAKRTMQRVETTETSIAPLIGGVVVAAVGGGLMIADKTLPGVIFMLAGLGGIGYGIKGHKVTKNIAVEVLAAPANSPVTTAKSAPFTAVEVQHILAVLTQLNKVIKAI